MLELCSDPPAADLDRLAREALPSERALFDALLADAIGELDLRIALRQLRPGPAPRWFLYDPMVPCDRLRMRGAAGFESIERGEVTGRLRFDVPSSLPSTHLYGADPVILPARIRRAVKDLDARGLRPLVLFEPRRVRLPSGGDAPCDSRRDHRVIVDLDGHWLAMETWTA